MAQSEENEQSEGMAQSEENERINRSGEIYVITCTPSNKKYVGQALHERLCHGKLKKHGRMGRWQRHLKEAQNTKITSCPLLNAAIRKYGEHAFVIEKLEDCQNRITLNAKERNWIAQLGTLAPHGYNIAKGGGFFGFTAKGRRQRSDITKQYFKNKIHRAEHSQRIATHFSKKRKRELDAKNITKVAVRDIKATGTSPPHIRVYVYYTVEGDPKEHSQRTNFHFNGASRDETYQRALAFVHSLKANATIVTDPSQKHIGACNKVHFTNKRKKFFEDKTVTRVFIRDIKAKSARPHIQASAYYTTTDTPPKKGVKECYFFFDATTPKAEAVRQAREFSATLTTNIDEKDLE